MRAAPGRAETAPRVIARTSRRVDIAQSPRSVQRSRIKVNSALTSYGTGFLVAEWRTLRQGPHREPTETPAGVDSPAGCEACRP